MSRSRPTLAQPRPDDSTVAEHLSGMVDQFVLITIEQLCRMEREIPGLASRKDYRAQKETLLQQLDQLDVLTADFRHKAARVDHHRTVVR